MASRRSNPNDQAAAPAADDGSLDNNMIKLDKQSPHRRKRRSDKHKKSTKKQRRSRAERLEQERLLQESIRKHTTLLTASRNPELFVLVQRREFGDEDDWPQPQGPHTISEEEAES